MIYVELYVHKRFSRMGCFDPATGELHDLRSVSNEAWALEESASPLREWYWRPDRAAAAWRACWSR